jgi:hypothetical protein
MDRRWVVCDRYEGPTHSKGTLAHRLEYLLGLRANGHGERAGSSEGEGSKTRGHWR